MTLSRIAGLICIGLLCTAHITEHRKKMPSIGVNEENAHKWETNFYPIEEVLLNATIENTGNLSIDPYLLTILERAAARFPEPNNRNEIQRVFELIKLSHPLGDELATLINSYQAYDIAFTALDQKITSASGKEKLDILDDFDQRIEVLQARFFGKEVARKLFFNKNKTLAYLYSAKRAQYQVEMRELSIPKSELSGE